MSTAVSTLSKNLFGKMIQWFKVSRVLVFVLLWVCSDLAVILFFRTKIVSNKRYISFWLKQSRVSCFSTLVYRISWRSLQRERLARNTLWPWFSARYWSSWKILSNRSTMTRTSLTTLSSCWRGWARVSRISGTFWKPFHE